jgi:hypothetical protein
MTLLPRISQCAPRLCVHLIDTMKLYFIVSLAAVALFLCGCTSHGDPQNQREDFLVIEKSLTYSFQGGGELCVIGSDVSSEKAMSRLRKGAFDVTIPHEIQFVVSNREWGVFIGYGQFSIISFEASKPLIVSTRLWDSKLHSGVHAQIIGEHVYATDHSGSIYVWSLKTTADRKISGNFRNGFFEVVKNGRHIVLAQGSEGYFYLIPDPGMDLLRLEEPTGESCELNPIFAKDDRIVSVNKFGNLDIVRFVDEGGEMRLYLVEHYQDFFRPLYNAVSIESVSLGHTGFLYLRNECEIIEVDIVNRRGRRFTVQAPDDFEDRVVRIGDDFYYSTQYSKGPILSKSELDRKEWVPLDINAKEIK